MIKKFITYCLFFFIPVVVVYCIVEVVVLNIPSQFKINNDILENRPSKIEAIIIGSSQVMSATNPEWLAMPSINLASGNQHHDTDFKILKKLVPELPELKTIVIEVSYSHFELAHNGKNFWKNSIYLTYYNTNCFERRTYFKDKLLYLSNPSFFSEKLNEYYVGGEKVAYNEFGFNYTDTYQQFARLDFDREKIDKMKRFKINLDPNLPVFKDNAKVYFELLGYLKREHKNVIIACPPMYKTYVRKRNSEILNRRDSMLLLTTKRFENVTILNLETDTINYSVKDYWNQSHLSPSGAKKFTRSLDSLLQEIN